MVTPSVRAWNVPAGPVDLEVIGTLDGVTIAANLAWAPEPLEAETESVVLSSTVPFQFELCCFNCREVLLSATLTDSAGRAHRGEVTLLLSRGECPDPAVCCASADWCPDPALAPLCI